MAKRAALIFLGLAPPLILLSLLWPHPLLEVVFALLAVSFPVALMALGAARRGGLGALRPVLIALAVLLNGSVLALLGLRHGVVDGPWLGGMPLAAAVQVWGLWLGPLILVALAYALTFERLGIDQRDLDRLRRLRRDNDRSVGGS